MARSAVCTSPATGPGPIQPRSASGRSADSRKSSDSSPSTSPAIARSFELPTSAAGDAFQRRVWELIDRIPYGQTTTYGELARELGNPTLARKVGAAVAHNPLSVIVPCHRVVGKDGRLTGYAGGLRRKQFLLDLEAPPEMSKASEQTEEPTPTLF